MLCVLGCTHHYQSDVYGFLFGNIFVLAVMLFLFSLLLFAVPIFDLSSVYCCTLKTLKIRTRSLSCDLPDGGCLISLCRCPGIFSNREILHHGKYSSRHPPHRHSGTILKVKVGYMLVYFTILNIRYISLWSDRPHVGW